MRKKICTAFLLVVGFAIAGTSQTLFNYGKDSVTVAEFLAAYNKNNTTVQNDKQALRNYLDLYIVSRLKIKEAKERRYDTLPNLVSDLQNLRQQILPSYLIDETAIDGLVSEAIDRSQKDIHLAHIFIAAAEGDTVVYKKAKEAHEKLIDGASFAAVAKLYSDDPAVKTNGGDAGYITVFTLPYEFENLIYTTPLGKISSIYRSKNGYHIFKNDGERKALGRMKAAQILLAYPPQAGAAEKESIKRLADSIYNRLQKGDDFAKLATQFSNDVISAAADGQMQEFGVGEYESLFEKAVFALGKDGAVTRPFETTHGWHIVKRLSHEGVSSNKADEKQIQAFRERVKQSDRVNFTQETFKKKAIGNVNVKQSITHFPALWAYTDSLLNGKGLAMFGLNNDSEVLEIDRTTLTVKDWIHFVQTNRYNSDGRSVKRYNQLWREFIGENALAHYEQNLENYNPLFKAQIEEFRDGNLFFEIMQRQIWEPAQSDTVALKKFYEKNKATYVWKESADAVLFYAPDVATATALRQQIIKAPQNWKTVAASFSEEVAVDSNRFDLNFIPHNLTGGLKNDIVTTPVVNEEDSTASFAYIIKLYPQPQQRSFTEAKGLVINDYQAQLEKEWVGELKKKYPVAVNERALAALLR